MKKGLTRNKIDEKTMCYSLENDGTVLTGRKGAHIICFFLFLIIGGTVMAQPFEPLKFVHYKNQDGLPSSYIKEIEQDHLGFIWLANRENLCRFDGYTFQTFPAQDENGHVFTLKPDQLHTISDTLLLVKAIDGDFYQFDFTSESFSYYAALNEVGDIARLVEVDSGVWYVSDSLLWFNRLKGGNSVPFQEIGGHRMEELNQISLLTKNDDLIAFVNGSGSDTKIHFFDLAVGHASLHGPQEGEPAAEVTYQVFDLPFETADLLFLDAHHNLWVCENKSGLCRINTLTGKQTYYNSQAKGNRHLLHNYTYVMVEDGEGVVWIGTEGGVCLWSETEEIFNRSRFDVSDPDGLSSNPIYSALLDTDENMWLGSYFSGINLWNKKGHFFQTLSAGVGESHLGGNAVSSLAEDENGNIWIGLEDMGLNKMDRKTGVISKYPVDIRKGGLSSGNIHDLYFENSERLWIATYTGGINVLDVRKGTFTYINSENEPNLASNDVYSFCDVGDSLFISTTNGISVFDKKKRKFYPFHKSVFDQVLIESMTTTNGHIWFSSRSGIHTFDLKAKKLSKFDRFRGIHGINFIKSDSKDRLWVGDSYEGLFCFYPEEDRLERFHEGNGFQGSWVYSIQEGVDGWFWVSTNEGMVRLDPASGRSFLFDKDSGMPFGQFNYRAAFKDHEGIIYIGSNEGLLFFDEKNQPLPDPANQVVLTALKLFNQPVKPGEREVLSKAIALTDRLELAYKQNVFTIEYSALNYPNKGNGNYAYYLEGFEKGYNYVGNRNFATYTNLDPGTYTFRVKSALGHSAWSDPTELTIIVHPPFWSSHWGYMLYVVLLAGIFILIAVVTSRIQKSRSEVALERKERIHALELNRIKLEFFTNISHELRTPLTLIVGPLTTLINHDKVSPFVKNKLSLINLNANRLIQLLNQLLEFRKIERGKASLKVVETQVSELFGNLQQSFAMAAEDHELELTFDCSEIETPVWMDPLKVEKVLINLISNAFKFTKPKDKIGVIASWENKSGKGKTLTITVRDTGRGMDATVVHHIFDRFYQPGNEHMEQYGSGIGLSFVHSLVKLHRGSIRVKSRPGVGTIFKLEIPVSQCAYNETEIVSVSYPSDQAGYPIIPTHSGKPAQVKNEDEQSGNPTILLVEDNVELLEFVSGSLQDQYNIMVAENGSQGLEKLAMKQVDIIVSDVMMPEMDGLEFTHQVKNNMETSHIPVILLTAKHGVENRYEGLRTGADIYLEKPFLAHILEQNISNVLATRRNLVKKFKRDAYMPPTELTHTESDKKFIEKLTLIIKQNMINPELDVSFLVREVGISRTMLHMKLKKLADSSATEFINAVRLKEALKLMSEENCNVSEAAYRTGFSSPTYFTRRFKQYYGQSPREFIA